MNPIILLAVAVALLAGAKRPGASVAKLKAHLAAYRAQLIEAGATEADADTFITSLKARAAGGASIDQLIAEATAHLHDQQLASTEKD